MKTATVTDQAIVLRYPPTEKIDQQVHILCNELSSKGVTTGQSLAELDQTTRDMVCMIPLVGAPSSTADIAQFLLQLGFEIQDQDEEP